MITLKGVKKAYGREQVLQDVNARFEDGLIHGLVGRNGSGKTVLLKCIVGLIKPDAGVIRVDGKRLGKEIEMPESLGVIIETPGFLPNYSGYRNLKFLADVRGRIGREEIERAMALVGLDAGDRKWVGRYSLGMRQRLGLAQAMMESPKVLVLDEPMNGLDNAGVREIRGVLKRLRAEGRTVLLASHHAEDIEELCDTVSELDEGKLWAL